jgi:hypothetical protein
MVMKKYFLMFCLAFLLAGCVSVPVQSPSELAATHGYVYVNLPKGGTGSLAIKPLNEKKEYGLLAREDSGVRAFGRWLPAGEYKLAKWGDYKWGDYPSFSVKAGHLTDLGSLIPFQIGGHEIVVLPIRHSEVARDVSIAINEYKPFLVSMEPIKWEPQAPPKPIKLKMQSTGLGLVADLISQHERNVNKPSMNKQLREVASVQDFFRLAKAAMPPLTDEPSIDAQANLYYGADFGQIRFRKPTAEWGAIDTGTLNAVTAVEVYSASIIAGFENGIIRGSDNGRTNWKQLASLGPDESVVDIDRVDNHWFVTTARLIPNPYGSHSVDQVNVYVARKSDFSDLSNIKQVSIKTPNFFLKVRGEAVNNFYYVNPIPDLLRLDILSMQWDKITPSKQVNGFHISPRTETLAAYNAMGMFSKLYVSTDHGDNWNEYKTPPMHFMDIYFEDKSEGRAVRMNMGAFTSTYELMEYDPAKKTWKKTSDVPAGCDRVLRDTDYAPKFCITKGGSILGYARPQWAVEFSIE